MGGWCVMKYIRRQIEKQVLELSKTWINVLETLGIVFLLYPHSNNECTTKTPELYFYDTGLFYLTGLSSPEAAKRGAMRNTVKFLLLLRQLQYCRRHNFCPYFGIRQQYEIDT